MSKLGITRHSWQLKTSIDRRRPFDAQLLGTLEEIQQNERISQSRAIMRLLWLGWRAYNKPSLLQEAFPGVDPGPAPARRASRRLRASKPVQLGRPPRRASASAPQVAPPPNAAEPPSVSPTAPVMQGRAQADQMSLLDIVPVTGHPLPNPPAGLMKLRTMALSRSVLPPEPPPRASSNAIEAQTLMPAVAANTLARLKNDGREL